VQARSGGGPSKRCVRREGTQADASAVVGLMLALE
jgi:hypothetical protein